MQSLYILLIFKLRYIVMINSDKKDTWWKLKF